jgi:hypothetical protein
MMAHVIFARTIKQFVEKGLARITFSRNGSEGI